MTLISEIITDAYRALNLIALGQTITAAQQTEGLTLLNREIRSMFGTSLGAELRDVNYGELNLNIEVHENLNWLDSLKDYIILPNTRVVCNLTESTTLDLHSKPEDGARFAYVDAAGNFATRNLTIEGNGRTIEGAQNLILNTNNASGQYFYRADVADWKRISDLIVTDQSPFPLEFDNLLVLRLALELCPRYGTSLTPEQGSSLNEVKSRFVARYSQTIEMPVEQALQRTQIYKNKFMYGTF